MALTAGSVPGKYWAPQRDRGRGTAAALALRRQWLSPRCVAVAGIHRELLGPAAAGATGQPDVVADRRRTGKTQRGLGLCRLRRSMWAGFRPSRPAERQPCRADWVVLACAVTWSTDTGAFFVGRSRGRHRFSSDQPEQDPRRCCRRFGLRRAGRADCCGRRAPGFGACDCWLLAVQQRCGASG